MKMKVKFLEPKLILNKNLLHAWNMQRCGLNLISAAFHVFSLVIKLNSVFYPFLQKAIQGHTNSFSNYICLFICKVSLTDKISLAEATLYSDFSPNLV